MAKKKPQWVIEKERGRKGAPGAESETVWLFGFHAVRDALLNPARDIRRLILTKNAADKLADALGTRQITPEMVDPRRFSAPLDPASVHQGAAAEVAPLAWGDLSELCAPRGDVPLVVLLDRVSDPHNVGAILRSAEVFGARAVVAPHRHSAPETGALAKTASGALERQPYLRIPNLARGMKALQEQGYTLLGFDGTAQMTLEEGLGALPPGTPLALVMGAEGPGLRQLTMQSCDYLVKIPFAADFGSLNVSNAAAVGLYAARRHLG